MLESSSRTKNTRSTSSLNDALIRNFPRVFFGLAFFLAFLMFYTYISGGGGKLPSGPVPGTRIIPLPPRQGHIHGGNGVASHEDGHIHTSAEKEKEKKIIISDSTSSIPSSSGSIETTPRRVERRSSIIEGREVIEETTFYGLASELTNSELERLGTAAIDAAKSGAEIVVVKKITKGKKKKTTTVNGGVEGVEIINSQTEEVEKSSSSSSNKEEDKIPSTVGDEIIGQSIDDKKVDKVSKTKSGSDVETEKERLLETVKKETKESIKKELTQSNEDWIDHEIPGRESSWTPIQRPISGEKESVTSHAFEEATQHSNNPPVLDMNNLPLVTELSHRLVIAIALGVHSGQAQISSEADLIKLPVISVLLSSFLPTAQPHHLYRFYFAYDHNDRIYERQDYRDKISQMYADSFKVEDGKRWHPEGYSYEGPADSSRLLYSVHWVHCDFASKPSWAHTDAIMAAYKEGADYAYRTNDDTKFPELKYWADMWILNLRSRKPANVGVVGPACGEGATWILTHDFTHKTHVVIFGFQYPRSLPNWSSDDWITYVYDGFKLMHKEEQTVVGHTFALGTRYNPSSQTERLTALNQALQDGSIVLSEWLKKEKGVDIPYTVKSVSCC